MGCVNILKVGVAMIVYVCGSLVNIKKDTLCECAASNMHTLCSTYLEILVCEEKCRYVRTHVTAKSALVTDHLYSKTT